MRATAETIWQIPAYLPYLQPSLTAEAVASAEKQIGYKLPREYVALLQKQNGGYIRFTLPDSVHEIIAGIGPYFPSLKKPDWKGCRVSFPLKGLVPFDGDGHWHLCLDYRKDPDDPAVTHVDIECDAQETIAPTFAEYLAALKPDIKDEIVLESVTDTAVLLAALSQKLKCSFNPPSSYDHGYPVHRAGVGSDDNPEWIWISPNTAPRGFVRTDNRRYEQLKDLLPGSAERFPEVPPGSYLVSTTDGVRTKVLDACRSVHPVVRSLRDYFSAV